MLINVTIENWMSFRDRTNFTMIATKEQQHGERLTRLKKYRFRTLPTAALYGGNASGKTNFFKAISFAKHFITRGSLPDHQIAIEPFVLDEQTKHKPTVFQFEILAGSDIYELTFSLTVHEVIEEKLVKISSTNEKILYHRRKSSSDPQLHPSIKSDRLEFAFEGTRENQLFLTNSVFQKLEVFLPIYNWFAHTLVLVAPDARFEAFEQFIAEGNQLYEAMNAVLPYLDTGICHLGGEKISMDSLPFPEALKQKLKEDVRDGRTLKLDNEDEKIVITRQNNELNVKKLYTYHRNIQGEDIRFEMRQESDGTKRIIDLLPAFLDLAATNVPKVYIIDEIDRNLHSLLTRQLLEVFLSHCSESNRRQLLFTTHDLLLMNQSIFRRDEMWITERRPDGSTQLISFSEYEDIRSDNDVLKNYLQGRMGGIPHVFVDSIFSRVNSSNAPGGDA